MQEMFLSISRRADLLSKEYWTWSVICVLQCKVCDLALSCQVYDVIKGLAYLHSVGIIHGDLRAVRLLFPPALKLVLTPS